ncbi:hypothetical protein N7468_007673 [Penicillium chermesinum]|uniref:ribonuclease Z n=1 Tax=Penicillium chermesinum TaxID=63820 RepID=A0A9W9NWW6_9EURO|nr:uncharacterized protein N7468_007673 [Penicillium chermesinum]KAJ5226448.1 hypothetical protein N7468_007673 [Penicillium chermesinum]
MKVDCQVVTTPTADTPGTVVMLNCPDKRYLFGQASEGTQRACVERGVKVMHLSDVFLTGRVGWANNGGLIGLILTVADAVAANNQALKETREKALQKIANLPAQTREKVQRSYPPIQNSTIQLHGGPNLSHSIATARRFVFRRGVPIEVKEYDSESGLQQAKAEIADPFETPSYCDANIKVWALPIKPNSSSTYNVASRASSPRKRSLDEFREAEHPTSAVSQRDADQLLRQSVVSDMFNSNWKMDALVETPLADVKMPAAMFVRNPETKDMQPYNGPKPGDGDPLPDIKVFVRRPWPGATVDSLPATSPSTESLCYIVRNHDVRGKFDHIKAKELNVPFGPACGALTAGQSVQSTDGKTITPDMVLGPTRKGNGIAIMDVPSVDYIESLINRPEWKSPAVTTGLKAFVWILGPGVGDHPKLREFVASMSHCKHTVSSTDYCPNYLALGGAAESATRLAQLKSDSYSIPVHDNSTLPQTRALSSRSQPLSMVDFPFEPLKPGYVFDLEPQYKFSTDSGMPYFDATKCKFTIPKSVAKRMSVIDKRVAKPRFQQELENVRKDLPGAEAEIIALGTGSSIPSKYRNVSATLIHAPGVGYYMLDCGENTLGQMERVFEPEKLREVLRNLRMIWISHLHADHHLGTVSLIKAWYQVNFGLDAKQEAGPKTDLSKILQEKRLAVVSDEMMIAWLEEHSQVEDYGFSKLLPLCAYPKPSGPSIATTFGYRHYQNGGPPFGPDSASKTILDFKDESSPLTPLLKASTGLSDLLTTTVKHCRGALAVSLVFPDGFKVSYSGDCRPSDKFASIGQGSTVLIHEATFLDDMVGSALAKRHSTSAEAIEVGRRMGARSILLTHFSQRYQKVAQVNHEEGSEGYDQMSSDRKVKEAVAVAEDNLSKDADIPFDDPEDGPVESQASGAALLDDTRFPSASRPSLPRSETYVPGVNMPAYAPALEKLVAVIERESIQKAEQAKAKIQREEEARKAEKAKKHTKKPKNKNKAAAAAGVVVAATVAIEEASPEQPEQPPVSAFDASESEDGWETSDYEA